MFPGIGRAEPVKGEATFSASGGYARLVLKFAEDVDTEVTTAGSIIVIRFKRPVDIAVDRLAEAVPDYVGSARRDPDGSAIRLSLARRVTINTMSAGERVFVDLLPDSWTGPPPGLPQEVVRELAERARIAERELRQQRAISEAKKRPPIRVRASVQPTFVRFVFEMPDGVGVSSVLNEQKLRLQFSAVLVFDLADAKLAAPSNIASINQKVEGEASVVEITMIGDVDVHSFREEKNYVIDVAFQQAEKPSVLPSVSDASHPPDSAAPTPAAPAVTAPATSDKAASDKVVSEKAVSERAASEKAPAMAAASPQPGEIVPPTSEMLARQAKIEINPAQAPQTPPATEAQMPAPPSKEPPAPSMAAAAEAPPKKPLAAPAPPAEVKSGGSPASVSASAGQRRPAPDLFISGGHARGLVPSRRYGVAAVRFQEADRYRAYPRPGWVRHCRRQRHAAGKGAGGPLSSQPSAIALAHGRGSTGRHELDGHLCRCDAHADATACGDPKHRRSRACQCQRAVAQGRPAAPAGRSGCGRYPPGGHGDAAGARLHQAAGFCRAVAAGIDPRRGDSSELRRCHGRDCFRQGHPGQARGLDAVTGRHRGGAGVNGGPADFRPRRVAQESRRELCRARGCPDRGCGDGRARSAHAGPDRSCPFLFVARAVCGSQGYPRSRHSSTPSRVPKIRSP